MTNEQREAIDRLDKDKDYPLACGDITIVNVADIDTVLSLIKEQQIYIKKYNDTTEEMNRDIRKLISEIQKKDKQIDLMAKFIENNMSEKKIINEICIKGKCNNEECHEDDLKDCIKQYFADLVEKE